MISTNLARRQIICILLASAMICLRSSASWAQVTSGEITGTVMDATKAVVPGVEVIATNVATGVSRNGLSEANGLYRIPFLQPGSYALKASLTGFKTAAYDGITVTVGEIVHVDVILAVGNISETVTISGQATTVDVEQGRVSTLVDGQRILDMPLNGRNIYDLMQLAPGAVNATATVSGEIGTGLFQGSMTSVNGGRVNFNGFWLDGVTNKGLDGGGANLTPNIESIQEFRMESMNFSAEFGGSAGSVVNLVSKSGTNSFHGSAFEFLRNDALDAAGFFDAYDPATGEKDKPEYKRNQFGASLGGPVRRNSTFFFGSWESLRLRTGGSSVQTFESVPWANYVQQYGAPVASFLYKNYPAPKPITTVTDTVGSYLANQGWIAEPTQAEVDGFLMSTFGSPAGALAADAPMIGETSYFQPDWADEDQWSFRIDHEFRGGKDKLFGRYYWDKTRTTQLGARPAFNGPWESEANQPALAETHLISPTVVNEFRFGLDRMRYGGTPGVPGVPGIGDTANGVNYFGGCCIFDFAENVFDYSDVVNLSKGRHSMKAGVEFRRNQQNSELNFGVPSYYFYGLVYLALDDPYYMQVGVDPHILDGTHKAELADSLRGWRNTEFGAFFNDDWKVTAGLTLNLGIRYDLYTRLTEVQDRATKFDMTHGENLWYRIRDGDFAQATALSEGDHNNFAPRFGFAWDPFRNGKMSIRGGYGVAYQAGIFNPLANSRWNPPYYSVNGITKPDWGGRPGEVVLYGPQTPGQAVTATGPNPNIGAHSLEGNIMAYWPDNPNTTALTAIPNSRMRDPYVMSWFLGVQREIRRDLVMDVNYVGTAGRKLIRAEDWNRFTGDRSGAESPTGEWAGDTSWNRINQTYGTLRFWENSVTSSYNALQAQVSKRFSRGYAVTGNYTFAKSIDLRSSWHSGATTSNGRQEGYSTDASKIYLDRGRSIFDARHRFVLNGIWELPVLAKTRALLQNLFGGWQINGILALQSGQPFTPYDGRRFPVGGDYNADGLGNDHPNTPSIGNRVSSVRSDWVNPGAGPFKIPTTNPDGIPSTTERVAFFGQPEPGTNGTLGRNTYEGPGFANLDFSLFKNFKIEAINEESRLQLRFELFNAFNRVNLGQPDNRLENPGFGRSGSAFDARQIQFGLKFIF